MNKKAKSSGIIIVLILLGLGWYFFLYEEGIHNPFKTLGKINCENSGGIYKLGFNEGVSYYYCSCPKEMYESYSKTCEVLTSSLINKCNSLTNDFISCNKVSFNSYYQESVCECVFNNSKTKTYTIFRELLDCDCKCSGDGCICSCPIKR